MTENDRLTHERATGDGYWSPEVKQKLIDRLAAYEDTGLMPEEVKRLWELTRTSKMAASALKP